MKAKCPVCKTNMMFTDRGVVCPLCSQEKTMKVQFKNPSVFQVISTSNCVAPDKLINDAQVTMMRQQGVVVEIHY